MDCVQRIHLEKLNVYVKIPTKDLNVTDTVRYFNI